MKLLKLFLLSSIMILLFSLCGKSPVDSEIENPIDLNEERLLIVRDSYSKGFNEINTIKPDGTGLHVAAHYTFDKNKYYPENYLSARWSPDKTKIVAQGGPGSTIDIRPLWLMDIYGRLLHKLYWSGTHQVLSHDGEYILFQGIPCGYNVFSVNIDGTDEKLVYQVGDSTTFNLYDISASGEHILGTEKLYYTNEEGKLANTESEILKIHLETGDKLYLTDNELSDACPHYNCDETKIAYFCRDIPGEVTINNVTNVYVMSSDGSNKRRLTNETKPNRIWPYMAWSPDGKKIAFQKFNQMTTSERQIDIFIVDIDTGELFQLTDTAKDTVRNLVMDWK